MSRIILGSVSGMVRKADRRLIQKLCDVNQLPLEGELKGFISSGGVKPLALCVGMVGGKAYATSNSCPHARVPLAEGHLAGPIVTCPLHGWEWNLCTGMPVRGGDPAVTTYELRQYGSEIFVRIPGNENGLRTEQK